MFWVTTSLRMPTRTQTTRLRTRGRSAVQLARLEVLRGIDVEDLAGGRGVAALAAVGGDGQEVRRHHPALGEDVGSVHEAPDHAPVPDGRDGGGDRAGRADAVVVVD